MPLVYVFFSPYSSLLRKDFQYLDEILETVSRPLRSTWKSINVFDIGLGGVHVPTRDARPAQI